MSETTPSAFETQTFDDRIDVDVKIGSADVFAIIKRSLGYLRDFRHLLTAKIVLVLVSIIPGIVIVWLPKIMTDQVVLGRPFHDDEVPFPPYMMPFVNLIRDWSQMEIMGAVIALFVLVLFIFGRGENSVELAQGEDSATQSENAMNAGSSATSGIVGFIETLVHVRLSQHLTNRIRSDLFARMKELPTTTLDDQRIGDAVYRVMYDATQLPSLCHLITLRPIITIVGAAVMIYLMNYSYGDVAPELIYFALALIPLSLITTVPLAPLFRRVEQNSRAAGSATTNALEQSLGNIRLVQSLGGMSEELKSVDEKSQTSFRQFFYVRVVGVLVYFASLAALIGMTIYAALGISNDVIAGRLTVGDFWVIGTFFFGLGEAALGIGTLWITAQGHSAALRRVFFFIDQKTERDDAAGEITFGDSVRFDGVDYHYPNGRAALRDINLELSAGEVVAIVGATGSGKTSLAYMIPGFLRPTRGSMWIDDVDSASISVESLRANATYVFQEHQLLSTSIRENLALAKPDATDDEMREALTTAGAIDFVTDLPAGLDTVLGRSGDTLSVGQQQRLCIARGLIRKTPILVLDEPTAALDPETENALVTALRKPDDARLVVIIAHRLSTIRRADRIIFLDDGEIRDVGRHDELMASDTGYRRYVELQSGSG